MTQKMMTYDGMTAADDTGFWIFFGGHIIMMAIMTVINAMATYQNRAPFNSHLLQVACELLAGMSSFLLSSVSLPL